MKKLIVIASCAMALTACAKSPKSIAPAYISTATYSDWSCHQLTAESVNVNNALTTAATQQENARSNDIAGVILIGLPVSSLSGDNIAPQIADLKGQQEAIRKAKIEKNCS